MAYNLRDRESRMKQRELAAILGITATRLNEVLNGKRKVNMDLAKKLYEKFTHAIYFTFSLQYRKLPGMSGWN